MTDVLHNKKKLLFVLMYNVLLYPFIHTVQMPSIFCKEFLKNLFLDLQ